jgi:cytosine/adenosine deaminase-related metal-dependent hydrolase
MSSPSTRSAASSRTGSILIQDGRIRQVGKAAELADARADRVIDARHMVVTPGFVNGHMHISYGHVVRGIFLDDIGSPLPTVFKLQMAMTEDEEHASTLLGLVELLKSGTVGSSTRAARSIPTPACRRTRTPAFRVILGECVTDQEAPFPLPRFETKEAVARTRRLPEELARAAERPRAGVGHAVLTGDVQRRPAPRAQARGRRSRHLAHAASRQRSQGAPGLSEPTPEPEPDAVPGVARRARTERRPRPRPRLDAAEIDAMARTGTTAAMCPVTAAKGGRGAAEHGRLPELLAKGVKVALGCDSPNNCNHLDIVRALNMAAIQYKDARQDMKLIPAETALELATLTGAQALGLGDDIGSLEVGKKADLVMFDTQRPEWQAMFNPINNLVYNADGRSIHTVVVDGRVVIDAYRQTFVDEPRLYSKVQEIGEKLLARTGVTLPRSRWPIV